MEPLELIIVLLCVLLGLGRGADLAFATDAATGLCTAGAVAVYRLGRCGAGRSAGRAQPPAAPGAAAQPPPGGRRAGLCRGSVYAGCRCSTVCAGRRYGKHLCAHSAGGGLCRVAEQPWAQLAAPGRLENARRWSAGGHCGQCVVLLECVDALYGEQFQLAPGTAHSSSLAGAGGVAVSGGAGAHAVSAPAGCARPGSARSCSASAGSCPGCSCCWQQALAAAWRRCCRNCFPALRCAASAVWGLPVLGREKLEITDKSDCAPLV